MLEKDFMAEVLKRFDKIDAKLDEHTKTLNEHSRMLNEHSKELKEIHKQLDIHSNNIESLKDTVHENTKYIIENSKKIDDNSKKIEENSKKIEELSKLVGAHNRFLVNFETEINKKISTLFDSFVYHQDKHTIYERNLDTLNRESFNYDIRISALEDLHKPKLA